MPFRNHKKILTTLVASTASLAHQVSAVMIDEIVISAQKREQNMQSVGVSVTAFTGNDLKQLGYINSTDIASQTPGLNIGTPVGEGNNPSIVLRGVGLNDFNDNNESPIAVYKDGIYVGSMPGQSFQLFDMERVEVLRGPQGTLYGRNATGGLVHYISRRPSEEMSVDANFTAAEYNQIRFEGALGGALSERTQGRLSVATNKHDGYVENRIGADGNDADTWAYRGQLYVDIAENLNLLLNAHAGDSDNIAPKYQHQVTDPSGVDFWGYTDNDGDNFAGEYDRDGTLKIETQGYNATLTWLSGNLELVSVSGWETVDKFHQEDTDMGPLPGIQPTFAADYEQFTQELRLSGSWDGGFWVVGGYYFNSDVKGNYDLQINYLGQQLNAMNESPDFGGGLGGPFTEGELYTFLNYDAKFDQDTESMAVFGQVEYDLTAAVSLTAGLRYTQDERDFTYLNQVGPQRGVLLDFLMDVGAIDPDTQAIFDYTKGGADVIAGNVNNIDNDNISGKLGLDWQFSRDVMMFANVSQGFKSGGFNAGFMDTDMQAARDQFGTNVQYDEEILTSYEVGIKSTLLDGQVRLNATAFYYDYQDFQALSFFGISQFIVNSDATVKGGELELVALPMEGLQLQLGTSFIDSQVEEVRDLNTGTLLTDRDMVLAPELTVNGLARYRWKLNQGSIAAQVDFNYQDDHFFDIVNSDISAEDAYTVWNASLSYTSVNDLWEVAVFGKNLADEDYRVYTFDFTGPGGFNQQFFAPPRWMGVKLSYHY